MAVFIRVWWERKAEVVWCWTSFVDVFQIFAEVGDFRNASFVFGAEMADSPRRWKVQGRVLRGGANKTINKKYCASYFYRLN